MNEREVQTKTSISWGGVLKGVAIVTAVAAVAVVGFVAFNFLAGMALAASPALSGATATALATAAPVTGAIETGMAFLSQLTPMAWLGSFFAPIGAALGITGGAALTAAQVSAVQGTAAVVGAGAATALATPTAVHHLNNLQLTHTTVIPTATDPAFTVNNTMQAAHAAHMSHMAHMTHHAAEHAHQQEELKLKPKAANWQEYVGGPKPQAAVAPQPAKREQRMEKPQADFAGELNEQRKKLEETIGTKIL